MKILPFHCQHPADINFKTLTFDSILGQHTPVKMSLDYIQCKNQNPEKKEKSVSHTLVTRRPSKQQSASSEFRPPVANPGSLFSPRIALNSQASAPSQTSGNLSEICVKYLVQGGHQPHAPQTQVVIKNVNWNTFWRNMKTFIIYFICSTWKIPNRLFNFSISHEDVSQSLGIQWVPNCPLRPHPDLILPSQSRAPPSTQLLASERQIHPGFRPLPQRSRSPSASPVVSAFTVSRNPSFSSPASFLLAGGGLLAGVPEPTLAPPQSIPK